MQSDQSLDETLLKAKSWEKQPTVARLTDEINRFKLPSLERGKLSFSGNERNHLFKNHRGDKFQDISGVSGLDTAQDGRTFAVWDFDRDGWQDIALLNINTPVLSLYQNQQGQFNSNRKKSPPMVALTFVGGNQSDAPSSEFSCRDGYGAAVTVELADQTLVQQSRCGEGLAAQNSRLMFFGLGAHEQANSIAVRWPSGRTQTIKNVPAGSLLTVYENADESKDGTGFDRTDYLAKRHGKKDYKKLRPLVSKGFSKPDELNSQLTLYTSFATWCPNCKKQLPQLKLLRDRFSKAQLGMVGVPIDEKESSKQISAYLEKHKPPFEVENWMNSKAAKFKTLAEANLEVDVLPTTVIVNKEGDVIELLVGVPTVSDIIRLLEL